MPSFNLSDYATVSERLQTFWKDHPEGQIITEIWSESETHVTFRVSVFRDKNTNSDTTHGPTPDATGHATERKTGKPKEDEFMLERGETSAVGRALAILGLHISKSVASRQEMEKVKRVQQEQSDRERPRVPADGSSPDDLPPADADPPQYKLAEDFGPFGSEASVAAAEGEVRKAISAGKWTKQQVSDKITELGGTPDGRSPRKSLVSLPNDDAALSFLAWVSGDFTIDKPSA